MAVLGLARKPRTPVRHLDSASKTPGFQSSGGFLGTGSIWRQGRRHQGQIQRVLREKVLVKNLASAAP